MRILLDGVGRPHYFDDELWRYGWPHIHEPWWWPFLIPYLFAVTSEMN